MKRRVQILAIACCVSCLSSTVLARTWELLPDRCHDVELQTSETSFGTAIRVRTTGRDPYLVGRLIGTADPDDQVLALEFFCESGIESVSAFVGPPFIGGRSIKLPDLSVAQGWTSYHADLSGIVSESDLRGATQLRIDLGNRPDVHLQIHSLRLRPKTESEIREDQRRRQVRREKISKADDLRAYLKRDFTATIDSVAVTETEIRLRIRAAPVADGIRLFEYPPDFCVTDAGIEVEADSHGDEQIEDYSMPRFVSGRDRLHSGWRITDAEGQYLSARRFPTQIASQAEDCSHNRPTPRNQKGLTSVGERGSMNDLLDLDVGAMSLNLVATNFVTGRPGPDRVRIDVPGEPVYFDPSAFRSYDRRIGFAREHDIVVTAIVLIPSPRRDAGFTSPLVHPDNDGGIYAMPDLSTARGARIYGFVLDAIAKRYRCHSQAPGAITNWIAHNEIDFHPVWTNMGDQPRPVVTETYYRSLRMIHNAAKQYTPHARVFASLTHHWVVAEDGSHQKSWRQLSPRELIRTIQRYCEIEGDFDWGVAYHPYPQSLFAETAWNDTNVTADFDTPLITIQNLDVLGRFMDRSEMRNEKGRVRPVLLSEQGFHTDSYDDEAQLRQASSLWYAMQKVKRLPMVESFHYHRLIDHPAEGGLMLGLRTLPTKQHPSGRKKKSWYVYQAIGTDREESVTKDLMQPSGRHQGPAEN